MIALLVLLLAACPQPTKEDTGVPPKDTVDTSGPVDTSETDDTLVDADGDGSPATEDCDDGNASIHPEAAETCDGIDNDCDGQIDEGVKTTYYEDDDGDSYGDAATSLKDCDAPAGYVSDNTDCDDGNASIHPDAAETCDGADNDCDGSTDEDVKTTYYADNDSDGYGDATTSKKACTAPAGYVTDDTDCDDDDLTVHPDGDEYCDGIDNDCDGEADEDVVTTTFYRDADGDGYGTPGSTKTACSPPAGYAATSDDCDDTDRDVHPFATEVCDSVDNDCDGIVDEAVMTTYYRDADSDGYGTSTTTKDACDKPSGYVPTGTDCDDGDDTVYPGCAEVCDDKDNDCDGIVDDGVTSTFYRDADGDGHGSTSATTTDCTAPSGYAATSDDCDDTDATVYPSARESCDEKDNDCDGTVDEGATSTWYQDADGDTYGDASTTKTDCTAPAGYVADKTDCDDGDATVNPGAREACDSKDNDCDGSTDEGVTTKYYKDTDDDGYGSTSSTSACSAPAGYVSNDDDCDDGDAAIHPDATEVYGNADDEDCDGLTSPTFSCTGYKVPGDYSTIASAVSALSSVGGTICLTSKTYSEDLTINPKKDLTILGISRDDSIIAGKVVMEPKATDVTFTMQGVSVEEGFEGYINTWDMAATIVLLDNRFEAPADNAVEIMRMQNGQLDVDIERNEMIAGTWDKAALTVSDQNGSYYPMTVSILNNYVHDAYYGIYLWPNASTYTELTMAVYDNTVMDSTYGVYIFASVGQTPDIDVAGNLVQGCSTTALYYRVDSGPVITNSYNALYDNTANYAGTASAGTGYVTSDTKLDTTFTPPRPGTGSPLLGAGSVFTTEDYWGVARPTSATDIGCVEVR